MSVYTNPQQQMSPWQQLQGQQPFGQQYGQQQPFGQQFGQQPFGQFGQQQPFGQFGQQQPFGQFGQQIRAQLQQQLPHLVTDLALRAAESVTHTVVEHLRQDPQAIMAIQQMGQLPQYAWGNVLVEAARRTAPAVHAILASLVEQIQSQGQGQGGLGSMLGQRIGQQIGVGV